MDLNFIDDKMGKEGSLQSRLRRRIPIELKARFSPTSNADMLDENQQGNTVGAEYRLGLIKEISTGGVRVEARYVFPEKTTLAFNLEHKGQEDLTFNGTVRWTRERVTPARIGQNQASSSMGVQFDRMNSKMEKLLEDLINSQMELPPEDPFNKALSLNFTEPVDLYWAFFSNLGPKGIFVPTTKEIKAGKTILLKLVIRPMMRIVRTKVNILECNRQEFDTVYPWGILTKIVWADPEDMKWFKKYMAIVKRVFGKKEKPEITAGKK